MSSPFLTVSLPKSLPEGSGGKGIRTPGLLIANETLYQLSYTPGKFQFAALRGCDAANGWNNAILQEKRKSFSYQWSGCPP